MSTSICHSCGKELKHGEYSITLQHLVRVNSRWGKLEGSERSTENLILIAIEETGDSREEVEEYVNHKMSHKCVKRSRDCPGCEKELPNWRAKMCAKCGATFESLL